jgi:hypothetical protein
MAASPAILHLANQEKKELHRVMLQNLRRKILRPGQKNEIQDALYHTRNNGLD